MSDNKLKDAEEQALADDQNIANLEQSKQHAKEVIDYMKNRTFGIKSDMLTAFCPNNKWPINPKGHTRKVRNALMTLVDEYTATIKKREKSTGSNLAGSSADIKFYEDITCSMLKLALVGFTDDTYNKLADDEHVGPGLLGHLAVELKIFLVDGGGKVAAQHSQIQQLLVQLTGSNGTTAQ